MSQAYDYPVSGQSISQANTATNNTFQAVVSNHIGTTAPTKTFAGMWWWDTTSGFLKIRNAADSAWQEILVPTKRATQAAIVPWGTVSASATKFVFIAPTDCTIVRVGLMHTGGTATSTDANDLEVMLAQTSGTPANLFSGVATTFNFLAGVGGGNDVDPDSTEWFSANANANIIAGSSLHLILTYNGAFAQTLTDLTTVVEWYARP